MIGPLVFHVSELQANAMTVNGCRRADRVFIQGENAFLSIFWSQKNASSHTSCDRSLGIRVRLAASRPDAFEYGSMQWALEAPRAQRSREHLLKMMVDDATGNNDTLQVPQKLKDNLPIKRRPTIPVGPKTLVPVTLHVTPAWMGGLL